MCPRIPFYINLWFRRLHILSKKCQNRRTLYCACGAQADVPCGKREELPAAGEPFQGHPTREHRHQGGQDIQVVPALMDNQLESGHSMDE